MTELERGHHKFNQNQDASIPIPSMSEQRIREIVREEMRMLLLGVNERQRRNGVEVTYFGSGKSILPGLSE